MKAVHSPRNPRDLHPGAWWLWAAGLAAAASRTLNPVLLLLIAAVSGFVVAARRTDAPWARAYVVFLKVALVIIAIRVVLQAVLSTYSQGSHVLFTLPQVPLPESVRGIKIGGVVTAEAVLIATYEGAQLGIMLLCLGAANALASPLRLLRCLPGALYEAQVACVVALTFAPQLVVDARRVHAARRLRGQKVRLRTIFGTTMMPVLESSLDRAIDLAAAMDAKGFGRTRHLSPAVQIGTTLVSLAGVMGLFIGAYGVVSASMPTPVTLTLLGLGSVALMGALAAGRARAVRSRYRSDPWALPEWLVALSGVVPVVVFVWLAGQGIGGLTMPGPLASPPLDPYAVAALLVALLPAVVAPIPARPAPVRTARPEETHD